MGIEGGVDEARARLGGARSRIVAGVAGIHAQRRAIRVERAAAAIAAFAVAVEPRGALPGVGRRCAVCVVVRLDPVAQQRRAAGLVAQLARGGRGVRAIDVDHTAPAVADSVAVQGCRAGPQGRDRAVRVVGRRDRRGAKSLRTRALREAVVAARDVAALAVRVREPTSALALMSVAVGRRGASPARRRRQTGRHVRRIDAARTVGEVAAAWTVADLATCEILLRAVHVGRAAAAVAPAIPVRRAGAGPPRRGVPVAAEHRGAARAHPGARSPARVTPEAAVRRRSGVPPDARRRRPVVPARAAGPRR